MTLLTIIQDVATMQGLTPPTSVINNTDDLIIQMLSAANAAGRQMTTEEDPAWPGLTRFGSFTTTSNQLQGDITAIAPDFGHLVNGTLWNLSNGIPVEQAITPQQWAFLQARGGIAPYGTLRTLNDPATGKLGFYVFPAPGAGSTATFEYVSKFWVNSPSLLNPATNTYTWEKFQTDLDTIAYPEECLKLQAIWRFRRTKGFDDWQTWKADADAYTVTVKTQQVGTPSFYMGGRRGLRLLDNSNVQDGNYPFPH